MKKKLPYILSFEGLNELYTNTNVHDPHSDSSLPSPLDVYSSDPNVPHTIKDIGKAKQKKVLDILTKYRKEIDEIEDTMLDFVQFQVLVDPQIYVARTKDIKTGIEYLTAKTFFPIKGGKKKEIKVYVGKSVDFGNDTLNIRAHSWAHFKMVQSIRRRIKFRVT